jgi:hypothetical protein
MSEEGVGKGTGKATGKGVPTSTTRDGSGIKGITHLFSGNIVAHSAVIKASGTLHTHGRIMKPRMVRKGPPEDTAS